MDVLSIPSPTITSESPLIQEERGLQVEDLRLIVSLLLDQVTLRRVTHRCMWRNDDTHLVDQQKGIARPNQREEQAMLISQ